MKEKLHHGSVNNERQTITNQTVIETNGRPEVAKLEIDSWKLLLNDKRATDDQWCDKDFTLENSEELWRMIYYFSRLRDVEILSGIGIKVKKNENFTTKTQARMKLKDIVKELIDDDDQICRNGKEISCKAKSVFIESDLMSETEYEKIVMEIIIDEIKTGDLENVRLYQSQISETQELWLKSETAQKEMIEGMTEMAMKKDFSDVWNFVNYYLTEKFRGGEIFHQYAMKALEKRWSCGHLDDFIKVIDYREKSREIVLVTEFLQINLESSREIKKRVLEQAVADGDVKLIQKLIEAFPTAEVYIKEPKVQELLIKSIEQKTDKYINFWVIVEQELLELETLKKLSRNNIKNKLQKALIELIEKEICLVKLNYLPNFNHSDQLFTLLSKLKTYSSQFIDLDFLSCDKWQFKLTEYLTECLKNAKVAEVENIMKFIANEQKLKKDNRVKWETAAIEGYLKTVFINNVGSATIKNNFLKNKKYRLNRQSQLYVYEKVKLCLAKNIFEEAVFMRNSFLQEVDLVVPFDRGVKLFGTFLGPELLEVISCLHEGKSHPWLAELNINERGESGFNKLEKCFVGLQKTYFCSDSVETLKLIEKSELLRRFFIKQTNFEASEFGYHHEEELNEMALHYLDYYNSDQYQALKPEFEESQIILIDRKNQNIFSEEIIGQYQKLRNTIIDVGEGLNELGLNYYRMKIKEASEQKEALINKMKKSKNEALATEESDELSWQQNLANIDLIEWEDEKQWLEQLPKIMKGRKEYRELKTFAIELLLSYAVLSSKNRKEWQEKLTSIKEIIDDPEVEKMKELLTLVLKNTKISQVIASSKNGHKITNAIKQLLATKGIEEELNKKKNRTEVQLKLEPVRNFLSELSAHIADACWANTYQSILETFPNLTTVMVTEVGDGEKLAFAGCFLLIETESQLGERLLVIRGFNPSMSLIDKIYLPVFLEQVLTYTRNLADKLQAKPAIVIDDHCGGASTNRPELYNYLKSIKDQLAQVWVKKRADNMVNAYDISQTTYLI